TASIDNVRMQLIDNWSNWAFVIGRDEVTAGLAIALIFAPPIFRCCRAVRPRHDRRAPASDPDARARPEWIDRRHAGARVLRPSPPRAPSTGRGREGLMIGKVNVIRRRR